MKYFARQWLLGVCLLLCQSSVASTLKDYYQGIDGLKGEALKTALFRIISTHTDVGYDALWEVYGESDMRPDGTYWDMYSGISAFRPGAPTSYKKEGDGINREHSVPQSWFGKSSPMKSDAFHVLPTDGYVNNRRSNYPYGEVSSPTYTSEGGFSKLGPCVTAGYKGTVFEPNDLYKGDLAQGYFYMATCYENKISSWGGVFGNGTYPGIVSWQLDMLLRWAKNDPVSQKEVDRNEAIYSFQHNRNPFIDFPNLAQYVWGDSVSYAFYIDKTHTGEEPGGGVNPPSSDDERTVLNTTLKSSLSPFYGLHSDGTYSPFWKSDQNYGAVANAFNGEAVDSDEYLLTELDLTSLSTVELAFSQKVGYSKGADLSDLFTVLVSTDYEGVPSESTWSKFEIEYPENSETGWTPDWFLVSMDLSAFAGQKVVLAFRYVSTTSQCYGWEITDVSVKGKKATANAIQVVTPAAACHEGNYDLSGRRVPAHRRGIVIRNGKKILQ